MNNSLNNEMITQAIEKVRILLKNNKIEESINILENLKNIKLHEKELIIIRNNIRQIKSSRIKGIITNQEATIEESKIVNNILELCESLSTTWGEFVNSEKTVIDDNITKNNLSVKLKRLLKPKKIIFLTLILVGIIYGFTELLKMIELKGSEYGTPKSWDTGWILIGDYHKGNKQYVRGPFFEIISSNYKNKSPLPRQGEIIKLNTDRNLVIVDYKYSGFEKQLVSPVSEWVLEEEDYTGLVLRKGESFEVRAIDFGKRWYAINKPVIVWIRIGKIPK